MLLQVLINGIIAGSVYSLVASGFSLIYSTNKFVHFAHGAVIAFSSYILFLLFSILGINFWISSLLTITFTSFLGYFINYFIYKPLRKKKASASILLIASLALLIIIESLIIIFFGADVKTLNLIKVSEGIQIMGAIITPLQIIIIFVSVILFIFLMYFMKSTKLGKAMRAVADNKDVAEIVGISSENIYSWSFIIGSGIAGIGAILIALEQNIEPVMGTSLMIKGFTASVIGGIGSVPGAVLGSYIIGLVENIGIMFLPSGYKDAIAFVILFIFLFFKPNGILGVKKGLQK